MPKQLREARARAQAAKADAAAKWQAREDTRTALADAEVPEGGRIQDLAEYKAATEAKEAYNEACAAAEAAEAEVGELTELLGDEPAPKASDRFGVTHIADLKRDETSDTGGFESLGEFIQVVRFAPDKLSTAGGKYRAEQAVAGDGTDGGYVVPTGFSRQILEMPTTRQIVRPRATVIGAGDEPDAELEIPALNQEGAGKMFGGVEVFWQDEESTDDSPETSAKLKQVKVQAKGVTAHITVTNKLLRNAAWATPIFNRLLSAALVNSEDYAELSGDGVGMPLGVRNAAGVTWIHRDTAGKVLVEDVLAMIQAFHPESMDQAVFVACQGLRAQIMNLKDHSGTRVFTQGDPTKGIADTLFGIPIMYTGKVAAAGAKGDLLLVDFTYYLIKDGAAMTISTSEHVKFLKNRTVIKLNRSVDGKCWATGPLTLEDGSTQVSPYVGLDLVSG